MKSECAWCYPKSNRFSAQPVERHAISHGMCEWHVRYEVAKLFALDRVKGEPPHAAGRVKSQGAHAAGRVKGRRAEYA